MNNEEHNVKENEKDNKVCILSIKMKLTKK